jgi:hypothetical protein
VCSAGALNLDAQRAWSDPTSGPESTLGVEVAPHDPALDARIASLVRAERKPAPATRPATPSGPRQKSVLKRSPASTLPSIGAYASEPIPATSAASAANSTPAKSSPAEKVGQDGWRAATTPAPGLILAPAHEPVPQGEAKEQGAPTLADSAADSVAEPELAAPQIAAESPEEPALIASLPTDDAKASSAKSPTAISAGEDAARAEADRSEPSKPLLVEESEDETLAPIDELSETPAPADDGPGDGRIDDLGEKKPDDEPAISTDAAVPLGEPDRIEVRAKNAPTPVDPNPYREAEPAKTAPPQTAAAPPAPLTRNQKLLRDKVRRVLKYYYDRPLNTGNRSPWEVMHCMLSYELHSRIRQEGPTGAPITAVGWLCFNQPCKGRTLLYLNEDQDLRVKVGPALQGHQGQLLALLAQARVRSDYPIKVQGKDFTIKDLIEVEKVTCYPRTELTFKLIGLLNYLDMNAQWVNDQGMTWNFPTLINEEIRQPIRTAACGGMHRLSGLTLSVKKRKKLGLPVDGEYAKAQQFVANYQNYAYRLQNPDGSFSTEWFRGPGDEPDIDRRLKTTGHTLEWLLYASSEDQLTYFRTVRAVNYLTNILWANRTRDWEAGPLGHALHALVVYDRLALAKYDATPAIDPASPTANAPVAKAPEARPLSQAPQSTTKQGVKTAPTARRPVAQQTPARVRRQRR